MSAEQPIGTERRRSQRIPLQVPLIIMSLNPLLNFSERCTTIDLSSHGCRFSSPVPFKRGTWLRLAPPDGLRSTTAHAVHALQTGSSNPQVWKVGVELDRP